MKVEWTCCFCEQKESFIAPGDDLVSASAEEEEAEEEEGYLLCTCCEKQSTWFHANKEICLQSFRERAKSAETEEKRQEVEDAAARVQRAHRNVQFKQSRKRGGESYFFYNCEDCSVLECFGCKKASLTREEPHNIGTLRATLCAVCGDKKKKASCSKKYKGKNYTRGIDSDVYLCSSACEKKFGAKTGGGSPANKTVTLNKKQENSITKAIEKYKKKSVEEFNQKQQSLSKWLVYFQIRIGDDGEEVIIPTSVATQDLIKLIPREIHFDALMGSDRGKSFTGSTTDEEKMLRGSLFVGYMIEVISMTEESERKRIGKMKTSDKNLTELQKTELEMTHMLVDSMDTVSVGLRKGELSLEDILKLAKNKDAVGIGGDSMLEHYKSKYLAAKKVEAGKDRYMDEINSQVASFEAQRDSLKATTAAIRDSLYKKLREKILQGADTIGEDDDNDDAAVSVAEQFSFSVLNKPVWPIVHQEMEGISPVCVNVNFWQWAWYHKHRTLENETTETEYLRLVETAVKDIVPADESVEEETIEESDAEDETKVKTVEDFKAYFDRLKKTWQEKHFTLRGRDKTKVLTLDAVPLEWQSRSDDSDVDMEDADEDEDVAMGGVEEKGEEALNVQKLSQELIVATAKHFEICVSALNKRYNTSVVSSDFQWTDAFPTSIPFDEFALQDASERAKNAIEELVQKALPKLKECSDAYRTEYNSLCSGRKDVEEASHKEKQDALDTQVKKTEEEFDKVKKFMQDKNRLQDGKKCFAFVMSNNALFIIAKSHFASTAEKSAKVETFMNTCRRAYNDGKAQNKVTFAWEACNKQFEKKKEKYGMLNPDKNLSFAGHLKVTFKSTLRQLSAKRAAILKEKEKNRLAFMKFLADFIDDKTIAHAKKAGKLAKEQLRDFLGEELDELYVKYTMYYDGENTNDDIDSWFPMLSLATKANRERALMEAEEDIAEAKLFESDLKSMMSVWKASIVKEADYEKDRELAKEEKQCFKYFKPNLQPKLMKEKDNILKAYRRHTMFHHLGHASFADCGKAAARLGYKMNRGVFAEWESRSVKKYMKYYCKKFKKFNPEHATTMKERERLKELNIYNEKEAEEGRLVALAQIREAAVMRWRKQIIEFKAAWKEFDFYEHKSGVRKSQIRQLDSSRAIRKGDMVEAKCTGWTELEFYNGEITGVNSNGTFDIKFDKLEKCREVLYETFCTTGWMETVRSNERTTKGLEDAYVDEWRYKDRKDENRHTYMLKKQPTIFETKDKQTGMVYPDGLWELYAEDDAIFGVKPGDVDIRGNPEEYLIDPVGGDEMSLDVMSAIYCPKCGLATFSEFNVYDQPYSGYFPDRNMYPNARFDNKNLQFCGIGDEYETNKKLIDRAKFHFAVHVGLRERYVEDLAKFTTRQFVTLGGTQCKTLPNGGCLQAFTRKQAVDGLNEQKTAQISKIRSTSWKSSAQNWEKALQELTSPELKQKHANFFRVDVRLPLWQGREVRAPPGYRLVQYPKKGWTWQLEPFFDPLQTLLLQVEEGIMQWHSKAPNSAFTQELQSLSALCQSVGANVNILHNIESFQCEDQSWRRRQGKRQFVAGDKPYAWLLPVAPAVNAEEDNKLNDVRSKKAKVARAQLGFAKGTVKNKEWVPDAEEALTWYIEDVTGDASLVRRLELRRNTFLAQQRQVMKRCQTDLSRYLIRRKITKLTSLYKSKTSAFVGEKMDAYSNLSFMHKDYKFNERPNEKSAAAPPEEVAAWMNSVFTGKPLRMYECKRSGKPCIYVESRKNNVTAESIAACAHASPPEDTTHFVTTQQYDIEADKFVQRNLKKCLQKEVKIFHNVLNELGREISLHGVKIGSDDESGSGSDSGLDSESDFGSDDDEESKPEEDDEDKPEDVTEEMKNDGWEYSALWEQYYRKAQDDRGEMSTSQKPILWDDGKYYAWEEIDQKERGEQAGGDSIRSGSEDESGDDSQKEQELSGSESIGDEDDGSESDGRESDTTAAAAEAAADAAEEATEAAEAAEAEAGFSGTALVRTAAFEAVAAAHRAAEAATAAEATATVKTIKEAKAATKAAKAAAKAAKDATEKAYAERFSRYIADAAQRARPSEPGEYDKQVGVQCGRHATNNFLELEESDRLKMLARFHEREPLGANRGYASDTIASMFQISKRDDFAVSIAEDGTPFTEDEWNAIRDNRYFMGFIARPPEKGLRNEAQKRKARKLNELKSQRTALHEFLNPMELRQAALDKTILLMCRQYIEGNPIPDEVKKDIRHESTLGGKLIQDIKRYVQNAGILQAVNTYVENQAVLQETREEDIQLLRKIMALQTGWHWVAVRKYASGEFYVINSQGPTVEQWDPTVENANKFSITKIMVFSSVEEAQKLQAKNKSKIDAIEKQSRKREFREITQFARDILKDTFGRSDEESDDLLGSGDEDSDSDSSSGGAAAQRPTKRRKTGALFRMLREMYI